MFVGRIAECDLQPGDAIERRSLHARFGGRGQGGIGSLARTPNVVRGTVRYVDEFEIDDEEPWYETDAPETNGGPIRRVLVFRLRPKTIRPAPAPADQLEVAAADEIVEMPTERVEAERIFLDPERKPYEAERREAALVEAYRKHLESTVGHQACQNRIQPRGELKPLYTDLYDKTANVLVEAKGSVTREAAAARGPGKRFGSPSSASSVARRGGRRTGRGLAVGPTDRGGTASAWRGSDARGSAGRSARRSIDRARGYRIEGAHRDRLAS
jgi:hypothetical protein